MCPVVDSRFVGTVHINLRSCLTCRKHSITAPDSIRAKVSDCMPSHPFILETMCQDFPGIKETDRYAAPSLEFPSYAIDKCQDEKVRGRHRAMILAPLVEFVQSTH